ncbi:hypothetical protein [Streptomyces sp. NPDC049040]|uniref:hypothetical protein n=1 Tax=Streptomyces sp. NPDC049040 TaxID=3365593 RepID=UPI00371DB388
MRKPSMIAASSAAALATVLVPGASTALAGPTDASGCQYYTDFDFLGTQLSIYNSKVCNGVTQPAYAVIEKVSPTSGVSAVAYGFGIVRYDCQGTTPTTFRFDGDINRQVILNPGTLPCG